jgi:hypothetical protein
MTPDQDGVEVVMCAHHPDEAAVGEDLFGTQLCEGCCRSVDQRDESASSWDRGDE